MKNTKSVSATVLILVILVIGGLYYYFHKVNIPEGTTQLPVATVGVNYGRVINGVTRENVDTAVDPSKLPPGLSLKLIETPCAPPTQEEITSANYCPPESELGGTPTTSGNYFFTITTTSSKTDYYLQVK